MGNPLSGGEDELSDWAEALGEGFFLPPDSKTMSSLGIVSNWAVCQDFTQAAISTFLQVADYYLVAQAHAKASVVVTHEVPSPSAKKIKIPSQGYLKSSDMIFEYLI